MLCATRAEGRGYVDRLTGWVVAEKAVSWFHKTYIMQRAPLVPVPQPVK